MQVFEVLESEVRTYCRSFPAVFTKGVGSRVFDDQGRAYLDFFAGAGALNYGHNNPRFKRRLIEYLEQDGITHSLDMATAAKQAFLERFDAVILRPRGLRYKIQFAGPTGTNAVEAALKLARKATGRQTVVYFANAYHGLSLGALAVTGNPSKRRAAGVPLHSALPMLFDGDLGPERDTLDYFEAFLDNPGSGVECPAAIIVESVQAEGGIKVASAEWLRRLARISKRHGIVLIVDDIQVGCGRTGTFFSFEPAGLDPDIVCLSKSISGFGLPMALVLIRPELDVWKPGEHTGTFRGQNLAFVTATEALDYWTDAAFEAQIHDRAEQARGLLEALAAKYPKAKAHRRGRGLIQGLAFGVEGLAEKVARVAFDKGLIIETAGPADEVLKLLPPLVISAEELEAGLATIEASLEEVLAATAADNRAAVAG